MGEFSYKKYSNRYQKLFLEMKNRILAETKNNNLVIEHIGSTAVPGLGGKGIIDISIGIKKWTEADGILKALKKTGFKHFHEMESHGLFASTKEKCEEGDYHIHISRIGTARYNRTLAFRDFLRNNPRELAKYDKIKHDIFKECKSDRQAYKQLKSRYFEEFGTFPG